MPAAAASDFLFLAVYFPERSVSLIPVRYGVACKPKADPILLLSKR